MDWKTALELISPAATLLAGARWVGRMETAAREIGEAKKQLSLIPGMQQLQVFQHERMNRIEGRHDSTRSKVDKFDGRLEQISSHDCGDDQGGKP